jgi:hypothetical protein
MNGDCTTGVENRQRIIALEKDVGEVKGTNEQQWTAINSLRNRLPPWAVAVASAGAALVGVLCTLLAAG